MLGPLYTRDTMKNCRQVSPVSKPIIHTPAMKRGADRGRSEDNSNLPGRGRITKPICENNSKRGRGDALVNKADAEPRLLPMTFKAESAVRVCHGEWHPEMTGADRQVRLGRRTDEGAPHRLTGGRSAD